jgi:NAD(P)-dependent dehydrogenase (short-subunit alcohol dehydrogenase family)
MMIALIIYKSKANLASLDHGRMTCRLIKRSPASIIVNNRISIGYYMTQNIVITGVAQGLGRSLLNQFVAMGHTVYGCDWQAEAIADLTHHYPSPHEFACVDVTNDQHVCQWGDGILQRGIVPDLLINNAGYIPPLAPLWTVPAEHLNRTIDVNVKGVAAMIRTWVPAMVARQHGIIITISAKWGRKGAANAAPFCASKWAIEGLTQALALELPDNMAAVTVAPGAVHTHALEVVHGADKASTYPSPDEWAIKAAPALLEIQPAQNGQAISLAG